MIKKKLQINCSGTLAILLVVSLFASGIVHAEELLTAEELLAQCNDMYAQADTLLKSQNFSEAKALFLSVSENTSDSELAMKSLAGAGRCEIYMGNLTAADQLFDKLKNDYSTQPELNENIYYFGHSYWNERKFDKAKEVYQFVFDKSNGSDLEFKSWVTIVCCQIRLSDYTSAGQMIDAIKNNYSQHADLYTALADFAYQYHEQKKFDKAKEYYQFVLQNSSDVELAYDGQLGVMHCEIELDSYAGALVAFEKLWKNHSSAKGFVEKATRVCGDILSFEPPDTVLPYVDRALEVAEDIKTVLMLLQFKAQCHIDLGQSEQALAVRQQIELYSDKEYYPGVQLALAYVYRKNGQYEKAMEIYNEVLQSSTDDTKKIDAHAGIAAIAVLQGNDSDVTAAIESLCTNFAGHETLGWAVFVIGEEHFIIGEKLRKERQNAEALSHYQKAIDIWKQRIIDSMPGCDYEAEAYSFSGISHRRLKQYVQASEYFKKVIQNWPGYNRVAIAFSWYEDCLNMMSKKGIVTSEEAVLLAEDVFGGFIEKNPDHICVDVSLRTLGDFYYRQSRNEDAIDCYETLIDKDINQLKYVHGRYCKALEAIGEDDTAREVRSVLAEIQQQEE